MALVLANRVQETGTANTTVSFTLTGAAAGFQTFAAVGNTNTTFYAATDASGNWEVGLGTYSTTGPTLTRTTIYASSNSGSAVTFSGTVNVFVTYPSGRSVNLDASGNVSALGTIASGTWNASTIPVAYGGTGVTISSGASSLVLRDANSNITANSFLGGYNVITAAAGTTVLTVSSAYYQRISGSTTQTIQLPNATTMVNGQGFTFDNDSSGTVTIVDSASTTIDTVPSGAYSYIFVEDNSTSAGSWGKYALLPASYDFSNTSANFGAAVLSNGTWNGGTIASGYGGTGLTTFTAANNALYSTSSSVLAAGTLPVAAGGTGQTTYTDGQLLIGNSTGNTLTKATLTAGTAVSVTNAGGSITVANTGVTSAVAGTGISVSGATGAVTITNSGVTSIVAGTGISVSGATGAVTVSSTATGATITGSTANSTFYVVGTTSTSGSLTTASISNTNVVSYNASTGALSAVSHVSSSDESLKTNWRDVAPDFIEQLAGVKSGIFDRIESGNTEVGVGAQSLQKVLAEAVVSGEDGLLSVNYGGAALVAAIKLAERVVALEARLAALEK